MSYIQIFQVGNAIDVATARLAGVAGGIDTAMYNAGKRAASKLKSEAVKRARERYAISAGNVKKAPTINVSSGGGSAVAEITWKDTKIALSKFDGSSKAPAWDRTRRVIVKKHDGWISTNPGLEGRGHTMRSTAPTKLTGTFVASFKSGHVGIFEREGGYTDNGLEKITEKMGLSLPQMVGSDAIKDEVGEVAVETFEERLDHEVSRLLGF